MTALLAPTFALAAYTGGASVSSTVAANLQQLHTLLQQVQGIVGSPATVTSAYRTPSQNAAAGGVADSQHMTGSAADVVFEGVPIATVAQRIDAAINRGELSAGQVIYYPADLAPGTNKNHVHISLPNGTHENQQLIHLGNGSYAALDPRTWPAYGQVALGVGALLLLVLVVLLLQPAKG